MRAALVVPLLLALGVHALGLRNGFVYDDHRFVVHNHALADLDVATALLDPASHTADRDRDVYRPLRALSHALDRRRWGLDPFGFHLHSLFVHLLNVVLAGLVLRRLLPEAGEAVPLLGAVVLAVHPLGVEVVAWISSRGDLYAVTFGLLALGLACSHPGRRSAWLAAGLCSALATLGKESAAILPAIAWLHRRQTGRGHRNGAWFLAGGVLAALVLRQVALDGASPVQTAPHGGHFASQAGWALYGLARTVGNLLAPLALTIDPPQDTWAVGPPVWVRLPTLAALALVVLPFALRRRAPRVAFCLGWALLAYLPSSSLLVTLRTLVTDRGAYPLLAPAGALLGLAIGSRPRARWTTALLVATVYGGLAVQRTNVFRDDATLWSNALARNSGSVRAYLAFANLSAEDPVRAEHHLRRAVALSHPGSKIQAQALALLADHVLRQRGDPAAAVPLLERARHATRRWERRERAGYEAAATAASLAEALTLLGRYEEAERVLAQAIAEAPDPSLLEVKQALLRIVRASQDDDPGALEQARASLEAARRAHPDDPFVQILIEALVGRQASPEG